MESWSADFAMPNVLWLGGLFNPQSFLTAIMQSMARKNEWPLDKMALQVDVTKKNKEDMTAPPREGAYLSGLFMEGARWDTQSGAIAESKLKELTPSMPVLFVKAIPLGMFTEFQKHVQNFIAQIQTLYRVKKFAVD